MNAHELANALAAQLGRPPGSFDVNRPFRARIEGGPPAEFGFLSGYGLLQLAFVLGAVASGQRLPALGALAVANSHAGEQGLPHFALAPDRETVVFCRSLAYEAHGFQTVWQDIQSLAQAAQVARSELVSRQLIHPLP